MVAVAGAVGSTATSAVAAAYERIGTAGLAGVFIELVDADRALESAARIDQATAAGQFLPLAGRTLAVKANIDVAGHRTTAACPGYGEVAVRSAPAVRALEAAGAVVVGITNMDQFATGLVGTRSPHGICPNPGWPDLIAGGSSSGSAVAVAAGMVDLGVGTDTAGSGRVPAAANGIVGLKPTRGRVTTRGTVPACASLDCISFFANSVALAATATAVASGFHAEDPWSRAAPSTPAAPAPAQQTVRVGVPGGIEVPGLAALLGDGDVDLVTIDLEPFLDAGSLLYGGAFVAERYAAVGAFVEAHPGQVDPVVAEVILRARSIPAWHLARDLERLARLRRITEACWGAIDVLAVPTVPRVPTRAEVLADPIATNAGLGTFTSFVNLLDLCALAVPVGTGQPDGPPASVTLIGPAWTDQRLVDLSAGC